MRRKSLKEKIVIHSYSKPNTNRYQSYIVDKAERDMLTLAEHLYYDDPKSKGREDSFNYIGFTHQGSDGEFRIITRVGHGKTVNSAASVTNLADTIDAIDERAQSEQSDVVGSGHIHPFPDGHTFLSHQDKETMKTYGAIDPGHLFIVINPLSSEYTAYRWDNEIDDAVEVYPKIIKTMPMLIRDEQEKIIIKGPRQSFNPKILEKIRRTIRDSVLILSATMGTLFITFFSLGSVKPELLLYSVAGAVGCISFYSLLTLRSVKNEINKKQSNEQA